MEQLWGAIEAVFESWNTRRAIDYRQLHDIPDTLGTAVNIVTMVFGNLGEDSGTGVAFTRDPSTGEQVLFGEYLLNAQGEDVVAGSATPEPIERLRDQMPQALRRARADGPDAGAALPRHAGPGVHRRARQAVPAADPPRPADRARRGARSPCEMVEEELITEEEAVARIPPNDLDQLLHPMIDPNAALDLLTTGLPASPGAASRHGGVRRRSRPSELGRRRAKR